QRGPACHGRGPGCAPTSSPQGASMATDLRDELPVPHFEHQLWNELAALHERQRRPQAVDAAGTGSTGSPPGPRRAGLRRAGGRPPGRRRVAAGIASLAAAVIAVTTVVVTGVGDHDGHEVSQQAGGPATEAPPVSLESRIIAATDEAAANSVIHVVQDSAHIPGGEGWSDEQSGAMRDLIYDTAGDPALDSGPSTAP